MSSSSQVIVNIQDKLAIITLNRPKNKNAITTEMYSQITNALESISKNEEVTITAITGTGDYYCSGTDLKNSLSTGDGPMDKIIKELSISFRNFVEAFINHPKILVAVVNGPAIGIAVTTLALCDIAYCADTATFQTPFITLGMSAEGCSSYTFPKIMGFAKANDLLLFNRKITAEEACEAGLIAKVFKKDQINSVLWPSLKKNAAELPKKSLLYTKQMIRRFEESKLHEANRVECERLEERWKSEDCLNAILNFMNRRSKM